VSHSDKHIFFCLNRRDDGRASCAEHRAEALHPPQVDTHHIRPAGCERREEHVTVVVRRVDTVDELINGARIAFEMGQ
jgi:hypothetical protein